MGKKRSAESALREDELRIELVMCGDNPVPKLQVFISK